MKGSPFLYTYQGRTLTIRQWATELGVDFVAFKRRMLRGWPLEEAVSKAVRRKRAPIPRSETTYQIDPHFLQWVRTPPPF